MQPYSLDWRRHAELCVVLQHMTCQSCQPGLCKAHLSGGGLAV